MITVLTALIVCGIACSLFGAAVYAFVHSRALGPWFGLVLALIILFCACVIR